MYRLKPSPQFERSAKRFFKKHPDLVDLARQRLRLMQSDIHDPLLKTHPLKGKLRGAQAASINYQYRIVFEVEDNLVLLLAIGTHDEVY